MHNLSNKITSWGYLIFPALVSCGNGETLSPQIKPLTEAVYASGYIQSRGEFELTAQSEGILKRQLVEEGDYVDAGQALFEIAGIAQEARLTNAQNLYDLANKNSGSNSPLLAEAQNAVGLAWEQYQADSINYVRYTNLWNEKATSQAKYDAAVTAFNSSKLSWAQGKNNLENRWDQLKNERDQAYQQLLSAREESGFYTVRAEQPGTFFQRGKEAGEVVRKGDLLAVLGLEGGFIANLKVDEQDISRLETGQKVLLKIDAYPDGMYEAKLEKIYTKVDTRDRMLRVDAAVQDQLPGKYTGLALEANIVTREKDSALVIQRNLLMQGDSVMVEKDGEEKKVKVEIGLRTLSEVEILSGIDRDTKLIKP
ncbi:HlyD family secretion protein [Algoriphagus sp. 4150]|uniref:efflux RND transporter periplasmic adaptor subunit n=1 Tax=Algoriphagus sp. 4150 TaxID=2817756 RepID=UPI00285F637B|nr:HlyD family efflux transporter periplasmic adaptor subunit [Algoriphagus sp. 4150]MDR7131870.1 HlyD family secretion protein [Algoriphagus sp. 4150]